MRPHWVLGSSQFWFRKPKDSENSEFVYVDPDQGLRQPAFDHDGVARALREKRVEASATNPPFEWIDVSDGCSSVRFCAGEKNWEWTQDGGVVPFKGDVLRSEKEALKSLEAEVYSTESHQRTVIRFENRTEWRVSIYWINWEGEKKHYMDVEAGRTRSQPTYEGHIWRVTKGRDGKAIASFAAESRKELAVIGKELTAAKPLDSTSGNLSQDQDDKRSKEPGIFVKENNAWIQDAEGNETKMSTTGTEDSPFGKILYPSSDRKFAVAFQSTGEKERMVYEVESSPDDQVQPRLHKFQYLKPGDRVTTYRPRMFDLTTKREIPTDDSLFENPYELYALNGGWNSEDSEFRFVFNQRGHQGLRVIGINVQGEVRVLIEEKSETFIDYSNKLYYKEITSSNSNELIWASERDGWNHLYLYDLDSGKLKNQITRGKWVVRSVDYVDEAKRQIWIKVLGAVPGQDPYYAHLARVDFDGSGFRILTEGDGTHSWSFSEDRTKFTDSWSRMDLAERTVLRDAETGNVLIDVSEENLEHVKWPIPERFAAPGRDNSTLIYGLVFRPENMDHDKKYPIIENIYAGPQGFYVPKAYMLHKRAHELANQGFVVVLIDGMGTNWRSKAFHDVCYKNLKDAGFPDRIAWMKAAASTRPWMDIERVGVYGGSAGGQNAMGALLFHNEFYSVAAADCGCHDNRMDKLWWNEAWMGYPVDESYEASSNVVNAGKLKGSLLLSVGELDTNVDPASTVQVVNALNKADKDYELVFIPGGEHGVGTSNKYAWRRTRDFLYRKLKGTEPPR